MIRADITEFYYITPIENMPSILEHGILSHTLATPLKPTSLAMAEIQERRQNKQIPGARRLHEYANLYFDAHNPMLSKIRAQNDVICVLRIGTAVLNLPGVIISDHNAACDIARFLTVEQGLNLLNKERIFARYWTHAGDQNDEEKHKHEKCAEVLIPDKIEPRFILGSYVADEAALSNFQKLNIELPVLIKNDIFF
jgi:hypothetical protein